MNKLEKRIHDYISLHGQVSTRQLYNWLPVDIFTIQDTLRGMREAGVIASANGTWYLRRRINGHARLGIR